MLNNCVLNVAYTIKYVSNVQLFTIYASFVRHARECSCESVQLSHLVFPTHTTCTGSGHCSHSCEKHCNVETWLLQCHTAWITREFYRCSTENTVLSGACCTSTVKVHERHSTPEIVALAASSTEYSVQANCRHLQDQVSQDAGTSSKYSEWTCSDAYIKIIIAIFAGCPSYQIFKIIIAIFAGCPSYQIFIRSMSFPHFGAKHLEQSSRGHSTGRQLNYF